MSRKAESSNRNLWPRKPATLAGPLARRIASVGRTPKRALVAVAVLAAMFTTAAAGLWAANNHDEAVETARVEALRSAGTTVAELLSYDHRTIAKAPQQRSKLVTGQFKAQYAELVESTVAPAAKKRKLVTRTSVVAASVIDASADQIEALLFLNQISQAESKKDPVFSGSRVRVTMEKVDGSWRVSELTPL